MQIDEIMARAGAQTGGIDVASIVTGLLTDVVCRVRPLGNWRAWDMTVDMRGVRARLFTSRQIGDTIRGQNVW